MYARDFDMPSTGYHLHVASLTAPAVLLHGGAGPMRDDVLTDAHRARVTFMEALAHDSLAVLLGRRPIAGAAPAGLLPAEAANEARYFGPPVAGARAAVLHAVAMMELDERFNAGRGSKLQRDGKVRTSAALADGRNARTAGIYGVPDCLYSSQLANVLLEADDRNLDATGGAELMRELGMHPEDLRVAARIEDWRQRNEGRTGTVGAVAVGPEGDVWACTATGGRGYERPGRVSDTPTPAGNYACPAVALSATGIGEQILDLNVCGRIATRVLDGRSLRDALARTFDEVAACGASLGVIAITPAGEIGWAFSTTQMAVAAIDASSISTVDLLGAGDPRAASTA